MPSPSLRRIASAVNARRYVIGCVCLLIAAAALRFYDLSANSMYRDEAISAVTARGTISEVIANSRRYPHSSPILYPLALWAVQKAASTELSVRLVPATASALTVGALLFLMPRLGVPRRAAFLAALLAALSVAAIEHAQDAREYSVDALCAALMIAGLLQYLRDGRRALLCGALLVGPLLQYGLVLFGAAALGVAVVAATPRSYVHSAGLAYHRRIWEWLRRRIGLLLPISAFAAGCALTWEVTGRYHWVAGGWGSGGYLAEFYYHGGDYDIAAMLAFAGGRIWSLLSYHMPPVIAAGALLAVGGLLASLLKRRRCDAVALLCVFAIGIAACAAVMNVYPFGGSRHSHYLGPIVFLAAGAAFHSLAGELAALLRRAWVARGLAAAVAVGIAVAGAAAIRYDDVSAYSQKDASMKRALAMLDERLREGDGVYVSRWEVPAVEFYKVDKPANYFYSGLVCRGASGEGTAWAECVPKVVDEMIRVFNGSRRIWLIHERSSAPKEMAAHSQEIDIDIEEVSVDGWTTLHLITGFGEFAESIRKEWLDVYDDVVAEAPSAVGDYNLYLRDNELRWARRPCAPADTDARFFLHIYPSDAADLRASQRRHGFDNMDFDFLDYGLRVDDRCVIRRALPGYAIERIHAGQFVYPDGAVVWESEISFDP